MKIGVLGNCQTQGVAQCIRLFAPQIDVTAHVLSLAAGDNPSRMATIAAEMETCDLIFIQDQPRLEPLFTVILERCQAPLRRWPLVVFRGFHPDCVYVIRKGQVVDGVIGPYHSALLCAAWAEGLSPVRAAGLFNAFSYAALGYFDAYNDAAALLAYEAERLGYDFSAVLDGPTSSFMHTVNHPRVDVLQSVARQALDLSGVPREATAPLPEDALARGSVWPDYPELARRGGWTPTPASWDTADMEAVARRVFDGLDRLGDRSLGQSGDPGEQAIQRARAFIRSHVIHSR